MSDETVKDGFVLFWKGIFSQWRKTPFVHNGTLYHTAEHWMMAGKARLFGDIKSADAILDDPSPKEAQAFGRKINGFDQKIWDAERFNIVVKGNELKFSQNPEARQRLIDTGSMILVEASPHDIIWGIGIGQDEPNATNPGLWKGRNLLGLALMTVRARL
jgi:ribA/ribD-fused uncharacterized protein